MTDQHIIEPHLKVDPELYTIFKSLYKYKYKKLGLHLYSVIAIQYFEEEPCSAFTGAVPWCMSLPALHFKKREIPPHSSLSNSLNSVT